VITVQIPAVIREYSPVACMSGFYAGRSGVISDDHKPGDPRAIVALRAAVGAHEEIEPIDLERLALIISDPTGAAHLAWWLLYTAPRHTAAEHAERLAAIGAEAADYGAALDCAARGLGAQIGVRGLEILRDYALRVVSHG